MPLESVATQTTALLSVLEDSKLRKEEDYSTEGCAVYMARASPEAWCRKRACSLDAVKELTINSIRYLRFSSSRKRECI